MYEQFIQIFNSVFNFDLEKDADCVPICKNTDDYFGDMLCTCADVVAVESSLSIR